MKVSKALFEIKALEKWTPGLRRLILVLVILLALGLRIFVFNDAIKAMNDQYYWFSAAVNSVLIPLVIYISVLLAPRDKKTTVLLLGGISVIYLFTSSSFMFASTTFLGIFEFVLYEVYILVAGLLLVVLLMFLVCRAYYVAPEKEVRKIGGKIID
ncbi:MAG: hypothetical protein KAQ68_00765 [Clostridiales bacterium]|nr:hypothetical protein [Clostridiales bacterium]